MRNTVLPSSSPAVGYSLSPGGLLLPYHVGALEALQNNNQLSATTPIAGSSAGSIAVSAHACGVSAPQVIEATALIAEQCAEEGGTRGRLLGKLRSALNELITEEEFDRMQNRPGSVTVAYQQVLPLYQSIHQTEFSDRDDLINAICHSSTFPFFTTNWPVALDTSRRIPRLVMDGFFAVPRERFGCPDFDLVPESKVDRTVMISVFPQEKIRMEACAPEDCISPSYEGGAQIENLFRLATQAATKEEYEEVYEAGYRDAELWCREYGQESSASTNVEVSSVEGDVVLN